MALSVQDTCFVDEFKLYKQQILFIADEYKLAVVADLFRKVYKESESIAVNVAMETVRYSTPYYVMITYISFKFYSYI